MANTEPNSQSEPKSRSEPEAARVAAPLHYPQDAGGVVMTPANRARRQLLRGAAGAVVVAAAGYFTWTRYLFPPMGARPAAPSPAGATGGSALGKLAAFPAGGPPTLLPTPNADQGIQAKYIVENQGGQVRVLSAVCTHQGCAVGWDAKDPSHFVCPCHGAVYDLAGKNVGGPAPRPLAELPSHVSGDTLYVVG